MKNQNQIIKKTCRIIFGLLLAGLIVIAPSKVFSQEHVKSAHYPQARVISYDILSAQYQELLSGAKDSVIFHSGFVTLTPKEAGELHSTNAYEEMLVPLEGQGQARIIGKYDLNLKPGVVAFIPPYTKHQIYNNGTGNFKYIYIACPLKGENK
jgi:mannose-6-phosphate isomerase-like protein (cupin superfamily)